MNILYACIVYGAAFFLAYCLYTTIASGRRVSQEKTVFSLDAHRAERKRFYWALVLMVLAVESKRIANPLGVSTFEPLFYLHLLLDVIALIAILAVVYKYTGIRHPKTHKRVVYLVILPVLPSALVTGLLLLY